MSCYIGRFAPTPSGPLHEGSLFTALASYLDAKAHHGQWRLRIEDIDPPREVKGASQSIIDCLSAHHLFWDGPIIYQSQRLERYQRALEQLLCQQQAFYCTCSRKQLEAYHGFYSGHCRPCQQAPKASYAIRLKTQGQINTGFDDRLMGWQQEAPLNAGVFDDFVLLRKEALFSYQLASVVDDIDDGISDIVRGCDILDSTFKQAWLYHYLGQTRPRYLHLPLIHNALGQKLSKQNHAKAVDNTQSKSNLLKALSQLNQILPPASEQNSEHDILAWAIAHWQSDRIIW